MAGSQVADGALCLVELGLRCSDVALGGAPRFTPAALVVAGTPKRFGEAGGIGSATVAAGPDLRELGFKFGEPVALRQLLGRSGGCVGGGDAPVPAPQRALSANESLARPQPGHEARAVGSLDDADLRQSAGKQRTARNELRKRQGTDR